MQINAVIFVWNGTLVARSKDNVPDEPGAREPGVSRPRRDTNARRGRKRSSRAHAACRAPKRLQRTIGSGRDVRV